MIAMIPRLGRRPVRRARLYASLGDVLLSGSNSNIERTLISAVGGEPDSIARASAAWALGKAQRSSDGAVARVLTMRLGDPSGIVRCNALAALARLQQTPEPDRLARLGRDLDVGVRANVVRQGGVVGTGDQSPLVRNAQNARKRSPVVAPHGKDYLLVRLLAADEVFSARIGLADGLTVFFVADERGFVRDEGVATGDLVLDSEEPRTVD